MGGPLLAMASALAVLGASVFGMLRGVEPFATWFYPLAWYPTLVMADAAIRLRAGRWYLLTEPASAARALACSVPFWLLFELANFRLANWYYVFLPNAAVVRWTGVLLSFATVLPAILLSRRLLQATGVVADVRWRALPVPDRLPAVLQAGGLLFVTSAMVWPRLFFPLLWGAVTLLADPWVYRRDRERSLLGALERGRPAVILELLLGGLAIGFLWELYNTQARGKWIYTVPGLEELKLFEMPLLGFLGFPVLALDGWAVWNALVLLGLAVETRSANPRRGRQRAAPRWAWIPITAACASVAFGMERLTISSTTPQLADVVGDAAPALALGGYDVFALAEADPHEVGPAAGVEESVARAWIQRARMATLRGIGTEHARALGAVGVHTVEELASADPEALVAKLQAAGDVVRDPQVRVWIRGANSAR